ncbi:MAG TPA: hypothetical protein VG944_08715 [Fimbriimonas sp.]|nr:hypothetical protein [Fimbriimonas sp.]
MAILFLDGFDDYGASTGAATDLTDYWTSTGGSWTLTTSVARTGLAILTTNNYGSKLYHAYGQNLVTSTVGCAVRQNSAASSSVAAVLCMMDGSSVQMSVAYQPNNHTYYVYRGDPASSGVSLGNVVGTDMNGTYVYIELQATIDGTVGAFNLLINGVSVLSGSGVNTQKTANAYSNGIGLESPQGTNTCYWDDLYAADTTGSINNSFLGTIQVKTLLPTGNGTNTQWTASAGSAYNCVNGNPPTNGTSYISDANDGEISTFTTAGVGSTGGVTGVFLKVHAAVDIAGARGIAGAVRTHSANYVGSTQTVNSTTYSSKQAIWDANPNTGVQWTLTELNAAEFGVEVIS